jgi:molybdenum cofactor cytidylyltransferase
MPGVRQVVGVLLAAGRGSRFGGDKLRAVVHGARPPVMVGVASGTQLRAALPASIAVVRSDDTQLADELAAIGLTIVPCSRADEGMGLSLACGVEATRDATGWVVALGDMPWIASTTIRAVAHAITSGADIAAPAYRGARGHPVAFSHRHYAALTALTGDAGAKSLVERERASLTLIDVDDPGVLRDVDTPDQL